MRDPKAPATARIKAATALLDRAYGRSPVPATRGVVLETWRERVARIAKAEADREADPLGLELPHRATEAERRWRKLTEE